MSLGLGAVWAGGAEGIYQRSNVEVSELCVDTRPARPIMCGMQLLVTVSSREIRDLECKRRSSRTRVLDESVQILME